MSHINHMETDIKRELSKLYKGTFGKGPDNTEVKIYDNFVFLKFIGAFASIEESLMTSENGKILVGKIRDELILTQTSVYIPTVEKIVNEKVQKINYMLEENSKTLYMFLLFENVIETV